MIEKIILSIYLFSALIKNKIISIIILLSGIAYLVLTNSFNITILESLDYNIIMVLVSTYGLSKLLIQTNIIDYIINIIFEKSSNYKMLIISLMIISFILSGTINSIVLLAFLIPLIEQKSKKNNIKTDYLIEYVIISSLLGSISTQIGSNISLITSSFRNMNYLDYFFYDSRIGIYIISLAMFFVAIFIANISIKNEDFIAQEEDIEIKNKFNIYLFLVFISLLLISSLFDYKYLSGILSIICLLVGLIKNKKLIALNYDDVIIYVLMFIYVALLKNNTILDTISITISKLNSQAIIYSLFLILSIILSLIFNSIFIFYLLGLIAIKVVVELNIIAQPLLYIIYFGLLSCLFRKYKLKNTLSYQILICMILCSYALVAFLYY